LTCQSAHAGIANSDKPKVIALVIRIPPTFCNTAVNETKFYFLRSDPIAFRGQNSSRTRALF
jgi:hypothetical protein